MKVITKNMATALKHTKVLIASVAATITVAGIANSALGDQPVKGSRGQSTALKSRWGSRVESAITYTESKWNEATELAKKQINSDLRKISIGVDGSSLAEEAAGLNAKWQMLGGRDAFRNWLDSRFRVLVLDIDDLKLLVRRRMEQLHEKLVKIDNDLFIAIRADVKTDFERVSLPSFDWDRLDRELNTAINHCEEAAWISLGEFAASAGASWVTGDAATSLFRELGQKDENGNTTTDTDVAAWIFGGVVGLMTEQVIADSMDVKGKLEAKLEAAVSGAINRILLGRANSSCWVRPLETLKEHHRAECLKAISSRLGPR